ncbi:MULTISPECIES: hypothetical protein [Sphingobacterium]|uniref:Lipoprotein n=1 Tax=Sphingobacterium multivorum TaxID=28454 RepID=A0A654CVC8_SPHMU|nr:MULTISPECIES: hypothetical protein [Sphingobacterium]HBI90084.1 hypothetical protein [Sphingobacterium sp.]OFV12031.1 hypothetical protein HMPREF3127_17550 [Sphingobacterium sp. HMSC13C05]QQT44782.1 hypothetical protein I6J00_24275 [Sphingobacterium multivorum]QQT62490.1 hypothetical protein I6I97_01320 [Sphingobacterium multivorum]SUJ16534.1 Uncharacterised protein [Sphingobacterium multivorum]
MKRTIYLVLMGAFLLFGCKKSNDINDPSTSGLKVEIKGISGWGEFVNITVDQNKTEVKYPAGTTGNPQTVKDKSYKTSEDTFRKLSSYVETYDLMNTKIDECARCVDGADYVITVKSEGKKNTVTIAGQRTDGKYTDVLDFISKL